MFELTFELNGRKINPRNLADAMEAAVVEDLKKSITRSVGTLRCGEHGRRPSIKVKGRDLSNLSFEISGCCDRLVKDAQRRL